MTSLFFFTFEEFPFVSVEGRAGAVEGVVDNEGEHAYESKQLLEHEDEESGEEVDSGEDIEAEVREDIGASHNAVVVSRDFTNDFPFSLCFAFEGEPMKKKCDKGSAVHKMSTTHLPNFEFGSPGFRLRGDQSSSFLFFEASLILEASNSSSSPGASSGRVEVEAGKMTAGLAAARLAALSSAFFAAVAARAALALASRA